MGSEELEFMESCSTNLMYTNILRFIKGIHGVFLQFFVTMRKTIVNLKKGLTSDDIPPVRYIPLSPEYRKEMVKMLLQKVSESSSGNVEMVKTSLSRIVNLKNYKGKTALMMASAKGHQKMLQQAWQINFL